MLVSVQPACFNGSLKLTLIFPLVGLLVNMQHTQAELQALGRQECTGTLPTLIIGLYVWRLKGSRK